MVRRPRVHMEYHHHVEDEEGSTISSSGSNHPTKTVVDQGYFSDEASSNPYKQTVRSISETELSADGNRQNQQQFRCPIQREREREYTPRMICDALLQYQINRGTIFRAYDLLANNVEMVEIFLGLPQKLRIDWLTEKIRKREEDIPAKDNASNKKRKNDDCVLEPRKLYTPRMISDALSTYPFSRGAFFEAYDLLVNSTNEAQLFFGLQPKLRGAWVMRRIRS